MKCKLKIAFVGSHGTGKSSGATFLASVLKKENRELSVKNIEENVRELAPLFGGKLNTYEFQRLAMIDHLHKELTAEQIYDIVICDRSACDCIFYGYYYNVNLDEEYVNLAMKHFSTYNYIFFVRPDTDIITNDNFRMTDTKSRNDIDNLFEKILRENKIKYNQIKTSEIFTFPYLSVINEKIKI